MLNITKTLNEYLLENILTDFEDTIYNDIFPEAEGEFLISRYDPSQAKEIEFIDGSAQGSWSTAYFYRASDAEKARNTLLKIADGLDNLQLTDTDGTVINVSAQTLPAFVTVDEKGMAIYEIEIISRYLRQGK